PEGGGGSGGDAGTVPLTFVDKAEALGLPPLGSECLGFEDFDGDGKPDVMMIQQSQIGRENLNVYLNTGNGFFHVVTSAQKLPGGGPTVVCAVGDLDADGLPDVVLSVETYPAVYVLHNTGGGNLEPEAQFKLPAGNAGPLALADFDNDGWLDLAVGTYQNPPRASESSCAPTAQGFACTVPSQRCGPPPYLLLNDGKGALGSPTPVVDPSSCGPDNVDVIAVTDYDADGRPDFFVANDWGVDAFYVQGPPNAAGLTFTDIAGSIGLKGFNSGMGAAFADFDLDGITDLVVSDLGSSQFYLGQAGGGFVSHAVDWGVATATTYTSEWAALADDFDSDGFTDIWAVNSAEVHNYTDLTTVSVGAGTGVALAPSENSDFLFQNVAGHAFKLLLMPQTAQASPTATWGASATADFDGDGRLDVAELVGYPTRVQLMHNEGPHAHWLEVRLRGHASNRDGIGARVTVQQAGRPDVTKLLERARGSVGQSWPVAHFGLGAQPAVDAVNVVWPSGIKQTVTAPAADQIVSVEEPTQ
ncbi:MAG: CRTAC1 family protein, partial [Polyangiaceae bacterium]